MATIIFDETFTGVDSALLGKTPDVSPVAFTWAEHSDGYPTANYNGMAYAPGDTTVFKGNRYGDVFAEIYPSQRALRYTINVVFPTPLANGSILWKFQIAGHYFNGLCSFSAGSCFAYLDTPMGSMNIPFVAPTAGMAATIVVEVGSTTVSMTVGGTTQTKTDYDPDPEGPGLNYLQLAIRSTGRVDRIFIEDTIQTNNGSADLVLPMVTLNTTPNSARLLLPMLTLSTQTVGSRLTLPMVTLYSGGGGAAQLTLPAMTLNSTGSPSYPNAKLTLPMITLAAWVGGDATLALPAMTLTASGSVPIIASANLQLPMLVGTFAGMTGGLATSALALPMLTVSSQFGGDAVLVLPMLTAGAAGTLGGTLKAQLTLPMLTAGAVATAQNVADAMLLLPMIKMGNSARLGATLPMLQMVAIGGAVLAVTYEAYSVNLTHSNLPPRTLPTDEVTRFTNFPFKQIVRFGDDHYGVGDNGLFKLGGDTDYNPVVPGTPTPIAWAFQTGITDFQSPMLKTIASVYFAGRLGPIENMNLFAGDAGQSVYTYPLNTPRGPLAQTYRRKFGRGLRDRYYALGADGTGEFSADSIEFDINTMTRRI